MSTQNYINQYKDKSTVRLTVLTNICRMLVRRGYMSYDKYKSNTKITESKIHVSRYDTIDNDKFLKFIETNNEAQIYTIDLDKPYINNDTKNSKFNGNKIIVKIISQDVKDVVNSVMLNEFLKAYSSYHTIVIFDSISYRVWSYINNIPNVEVFGQTQLMIDLMSHKMAPIECSIIGNDDISHFVNPKLTGILENDPLAKYYNAKKGDILRILRPSLSNSVEVGLRRVVEPKDMFS